MNGRAAVLFALLALAQANAGELTRRFELTRHRVMQGGPPAYTRSFLVADLIPDSGRLFARFSGDLSGRYLGAMASSGPAALEAAQGLAPRVFELQRADGGFGRPLSASGANLDDMARLWGHGRLLVGLVEYYQATGDERSLEAARRLGDYLLSLGERFNAASVRDKFRDGSMAHGYICWTQTVEGLALLSRAAGDERYRTAASEIAGFIERRPSQHAHGWLTSLRGLTLLAADDAEMLSRAESEWERLAASENMLWTGGLPEYFAPGLGRDEGCVSADWVRLNLDLWQLTGNDRYVAAAEDGLLNALFANQQSSGDFGHLTMSEEGFDYRAVQAWWCCTLHGLRVFREIETKVFRAENGALVYGLAVDGTGSAGAFEVEADAELARDGRVSFRVLRAPDHEATLRIRTPARVSKVRSDYGEDRGGWLEIERQWESGETFSVEYELETSLEQDGEARVFRRGPYRLGISEGVDPGYFNEAFQRQLAEQVVMEPGDRASRVVTPFTQASFENQQASITLRPLAERWESPAHAMRWTVRFLPEQARPRGLRRTLSEAYRLRRSLASGFGLGVVATLFGFWLLARRKRQRAR